MKGRDCVRGAREFAGPKIHFRDMRLANKQRLDHTRPIEALAHEFVLVVGQFALIKDRVEWPVRPRW